MYGGGDEEGPSRQAGALLESLDDEERDERGAEAEGSEPGREVDREGSTVGAVAECLAQLGPAARSDIRCHVPGRLRRHHSRFALGEASGGEEDQGDDGGDGERAGVEEEGRADRHREQDAADSRARHAADEESALPGRGGTTALVRIDYPQEQCHGRDGEHRRSDAADTAQDEQLHVGLGQSCEEARDRDDR